MQESSRFSVVLSVIYTIFGALRLFSALAWFIRRLQEASGSREIIIRTAQVLEARSRELLRLRMIEEDVRSRDQRGDSICMGYSAAILSPSS